MNTAYGILGILGMIALGSSHAYKWGKEYGYKRGFKDGYEKGKEEIDAWWLNAEAEVDQARQKIWKEEAP